MLCQTQMYKYYPLPYCQSSSLAALLIPLAVLSLGFFLTERQGNKMKIKANKIPMLITVHVYLLQTINSNFTLLLEVKVQITVWSTSRCISPPQALIYKPCRLTVKLISSVKLLVFIFTLSVSGLCF